jgi:hypothetical protein
MQETPPAMVLVAHQWTGSGFPFLDRHFLGSPVLLLRLG